MGFMFSASGTLSSRVSAAVTVVKIAPIKFNNVRGLQYE